MVAKIDAATTIAQNSGRELLQAVDLVFDDIPAPSLQHLRELVAGDVDAFYYNSRNEIANVLADPQARFATNQHSICVVDIPTPRWLMARSQNLGSVRIEGIDGDGQPVDEIVAMTSPVTDELGGFAGNTVARLTQVTRIEALDSFTELSVGIVHRFDTPNISGAVGDFEPSREAGERPDERKFGRHTLEVEDLDAGQPQSNFLVGVSLSDPGVSPQSLSLAEGQNLVRRGQRGRRGCSSMIAALLGAPSRCRNR